MPVADVHIDSIAAGGDGVARHEGLVIFVPRSAPGDRVTVRYDVRGRFARGEITHLVLRSAQRVEPPCVHYTADRCGGCQLQHLGYEAQLETKQRIVTDALERIGRVRAEVPPPTRSPEEWRYRRKLTLALRRRGGQWIAGLHPYDAPGRVFALRDCPITADQVLQVWRSVMAAAEFLPRADELRGAVRVGTTASLVLEGGARWPASAAFFERATALGELWWISEAGRRRLMHRRGAEQPPGAAFAQVNTGMAQVLHAFVLEQARQISPATAIDAYAGTGATAIPLSRDGVRVTAIELDADAASWCAERLAPGSRAVAARVEEVIGGALPADLVLLNPPRAGVHERVTAAIESARPPQVIYVSCNPATLARDLGRLPGYGVLAVRPFDMFPQTAHVETVCVLRAEAA